MHYLKFSITIFSTNHVAGSEYKFLSRLSIRTVPQKQLNGFYVVFENLYILRDRSIYMFTVQQVGCGPIKMANPDPSIDNFLTILNNTKRFNKIVKIQFVSLTKFCCTLYHFILTTIMICL